MLFNTDGSIKIIQLKQNREFKRKEEDASELAYFFFFCIVWLKAELDGNVYLYFEK